MESKGSNGQVQDEEAQGQDDFKAMKLAIALQEDDGVDGKGKGDANKASDAQCYGQKVPGLHRCRSIITSLDETIKKKKQK